MTSDDQRERPGAVGADPYVGTVLAGRYRMIRKLGEGGMGTVYLAEHLSLEKPVAIKLLGGEFARQADLVERFRREARAASSIGHEHIVDVTDFGRTDSGVEFFVMEYLDGRDLAAHLHEDGPMGLARARRVVLQICRALGAAHAKGIVHRDLKPENIYLLQREDQPDFVKVLDFGLAWTSRGASQPRITRTGIVFGTPEFMSPEQATGERADHRADVYAVGCLLYEMLTGSVPFDGDSFMQVLTRQVFQPPVPPSERAPELGIPADVEAVVMKALAKKREERFQTMKEMALAVAACGGADTADGWGDEPSIVTPAEEGEALAGPLASTRRQSSQEPPAPVRGAELPSRAGGSRMRVALLAGAAVGLAGMNVALVLAIRSQRAPATGTPIAAPSPPRAAPDTRSNTPPDTRSNTAPDTRSNTPPDTRSNTPPDTPALAVPPGGEARPVSPPGAAWVRLSIRSVPPGAEVLKNGELIGRTPASFPFPQSAAPLALTLRLPDHKPQTLTVDLSRDGEYQVELTRQPRAPRAPTPAAPPEEKPPEEPAPRPIEELQAPSNL